MHPSNMELHRTMATTSLMGSWVEGVARDFLIPTRFCHGGDIRGVRVCLGIHYAFPLRAFIGCRQSSFEKETHIHGRHSRRTDIDPAASCGSG